MMIDQERRPFTAWIAGGVGAVGDRVWRQHEHGGPLLERGAQSHRAVQYAQPGGEKHNLRLAGDSCIAVSQAHGQQLVAAIPVAGRRFYAAIVDGLGGKRFPERRHDRDRRAEDVINVVRLGEADEGFGSRHAGAIRAIALDQPAPVVKVFSHPIGSPVFRLARRRSPSFQRQAETAENGAQNLAPPLSRHV